MITPTPAVARSPHVLTLSCPDRLGIVHAVTGALASFGWNVKESQQFGDGETGRFFMRVFVEALSPAATPGAVQEALGELAERFEMDWEWHDVSVRVPVLVMVSHVGHCLNDLLYRYRIGALPITIPAIVSNHREFEGLAASYEVPFHYLPVTPTNGAQQEAAVLDLVHRHGIELVVLARYMRILSPAMCDRLAGRAINIHHGLLPAFKGANPYRQAYDRGVKVIGATAHYVTANLDEGPIIEQAVHPVDHTMGPERLAALGGDLECQALARAIGWHVERRVFVNGARTVVFR